MLTEKISEAEIKKIFNNKAKIDYLLELGLKIPPNISEQDNLIINSWNYERAKGILRDLFTKSNKYRNCKAAGALMDQAIRDMKAMGYNVEWPFAASNFDAYIHKLNRYIGLTEKEKDIKLQREVVQFRRMKDINSKRNDYLEYLIFSKNENIIPTFNNTIGVDFYINGKAYDQKVSRSVGGSFTKKYGANYRKIALSNPAALAESLYENQDAARFGSEPRLFVVYLDNDISTEDIVKSVDKIDFDNPLMVSFRYPVNNKKYETECFVVLLHKH